MDAKQLTTIQDRLGDASSALGDVELALRTDPDVDSEFSSEALALWNQVIDLKDDLYEDFGIV